MSAFALGLVLAAAFLHASWNAMVKGGNDRALVLAGVAIAHVVLGLALVLIFPLPAMASWPPLLASALLHYGYYALLFRAYGLGDLSAVYPISRGLSPFIVTIASLILLGENLGPFGWAGLLAICLGIGVLAIQAGSLRASRKALTAAIILGLCVASYSVADGIGVRLSDNPLGYMGWLFLLEFPVPLVIWLSRIKANNPLVLRSLGPGLMAGLFSVLAYGMVLYAKTEAPLGAVSAIRESSVIIAALIGVIVFHERPWQGRLIAALIVAIGVILLAMSDTQISDLTNIYA